MKRSPIKTKIVRNKLLRAKVKERDGGICCRCGRYDAKFEADHIVALWSGGRDTLDNMQTLCRACHMQKSVGETPVRAKTDRLAARHAQTKKRKPVRAAQLSANALSVRTNA